jgi:hypothetical protein
MKYITAFTKDLHTIQRYLSCEDLALLGDSNHFSAVTPT